MSLQAMITALYAAQAAHIARRSEISIEIVDLQRKKEDLGDQQASLGASLDKIEDHIAALEKLDAAFIDSLMPAPRFLSPDPMTDEQFAALKAELEKPQPMARIMTSEEIGEVTFASISSFHHGLEKIKGDIYIRALPNERLDAFMQQGPADEFTAIWEIPKVRCIQHKDVAYDDDQTAIFKEVWTTLHERTKRAFDGLAEMVGTIDGEPATAEEIVATGVLDPIIGAIAEASEMIESDALSAGPVEITDAHIKGDENAINDPEPDAAAEEPAPVAEEPSAEEQPTEVAAAMSDIEQEAEARQKFHDTAREIQNRFTEEGGKIVVSKAKERIGYEGKVVDMPAADREAFLKAMEECALERYNETETEDFKDEVDEIAAKFPDDLTRNSSLKRAVHKTHVAANRALDIPARLRPDFLRHFRAEVDALKATAHSLPDVHPELPGMTQDDQDVLTVMRSERNSDGVCTLTASEIAKAANVRKAGLEGDIFKRLEKLGKLARAVPDYPIRWRVADSDATFPHGKPVGPKDVLAPTASALLSRSTRSTRGKVFSTLQQGMNNGFASYQPSKMAIRLQISLPQFRDAIDQLVREGTLKIHEGHASGWFKAEFLKSAPAA